MTDGIYSAVSRWLFGEALPFWARSGIDRTHGGYVEHLRRDGTDPKVDFKRVRVIGRQIYVFSHSALLGWTDGNALARHGYEFLIKNAWLGAEGGWARRLDRRGAVTDPTPDLYDLAFVLFALGWFYRASGDAEPLHWAHRTLDFIDTQMRPASGKGFLTTKPEVGPRLQNPHMHLLEAALVNFQVSGDVRFRSLADELVALFCKHLYDPATQTLGETFNQDWSRAGSDAGRIVEPGHHFEWAWILAAYQQATGRNMARYVRDLVEFAERYGVDRLSGATYDFVRDDGVVIDRGLRAWPNCERIQAAVAMYELDGRDPRPTFEMTGKLLLERFLAHAPRGTWIDHFNADGSTKADKIPASTLYHLVIAFAEMLRVKEAVARAFP